MNEIDIPSIDQMFDPASRDQLSDAEFAAGESAMREFVMLWEVSAYDLDIAVRCGVPLERVRYAADLLRQEGCQLRPNRVGPTGV